MALTKAVAAVDEWAEVAQNAAREGATVALATYYEAILSIWCCLSTTTAHTGTKIKVQVSANTAGDEDWHDIASFTACVGTAVTAAIAATEPVGETQIAITNPTTVNVHFNNKLKFIEHTTVANSEVVYMIGGGLDTDDFITILDGLANEQTAAASVLWDVHDATTSAVNEFTVILPLSANRCRVVYDNTYDADGSTVHTNCRLSGVTAIS